VEVGPRPQTANGGWHCCQPPLSQLPPPPGRVAAPAGWVGSRPSEPRAVPRSAPSALARGRCLSGSRTRPFGLASIPSRSPAGRGCAAGFRRFQPGAEAPEPVPFGSGIGANPSAFAIGFRSKQAPTFGLSASDRSELRPSAANIEEVNLCLCPLRLSRRSKAPPVPPGSLRSKQAPILRRRLQRAETRFCLPVRARGEPRFLSGRIATRSKLRSGPSAFTSAGRFPLPLRRLQHLRPRLPALPGGFSKSGRASAFAYAGPASSTVPLPVFRPLLLRGTRFPPSAASGRDRFRFRDRFPSVHVPKAVMDFRVGQAESACG
jgi:hypothetical protein